MMSQVDDSVDFLKVVAKAHIEQQSFGKQKDFRIVDPKADTVTNKPTADQLKYI